VFRSDVKLGNEPQRLAKDATLFRNEKCVISAHAGALCLPILVDGVIDGELFFGEGEFTLDAIVETARGAVGKSIVRSLSPSLPFLMVGDVESLKEDLVAVTTQDLAEVGYKSVEEFLKTANEAFDHFTHRRHNHMDIERDTRVFAFATESGKWDFLIAKDDKLVYASEQNVYISKDNGESVCTGPGELFVAKKGRTVVIDKGGILVERE
jgi:hypothetical protein